MCFPGAGEHVSTQVQVECVDERLYPQQRQWRQLVLEM
jgi:hypothetical protein